MSVELNSDLSGRDHYDSTYRSGGEEQFKWLKLGAADKVDSIAQLLSQAAIVPRHLVELGAGSGAVISECKSRGIAANYTAIDFSDTALNNLRKNEPSIATQQADITSDAFSPPVQSDTLVLTHVLEHLENPAEFLKNIKQRMKFNQIIIEVPLEDLFISRIKALIKPRADNLAGHVQFYTPESFENLVAGCGFEIIGKRIYIPVPSASTLSFLVKKDKLPWWRFYYMFVVRILMPKLAEPLWKRVFYAHEALLCRPR